MSNSLSTNIDLEQVRGIARRKLQQYSKSDLKIRESYLFDQDFLTGVRYESGPICFLWNATESSASILRNELLIESVNLGPDVEERRAA